MLWSDFFLFLGDTYTDLIELLYLHTSHKSKLQRPTWGLCCHMCCGSLIIYHCNWPTSRFFGSGVKGTFCSRFGTEYNKYRSSGHYCSQQSCPDTTLQLLRAQAHVNDFFVVCYSNSAEPHEEPSFFLLQASGHKRSSKRLLSFPYSYLTFVSYPVYW